MTTLSLGNAPDTGTRQPAMTVETLGYTMGQGDRLRTEGWLAHRAGRLDLLPNDHPYRVYEPMAA